MLDELLPIIVAGDVMLDVVNKRRGVEVGVGGAGTAVRALLAEGVDPRRITLASWFRDDAVGARIEKLVAEDGVELVRLEGDHGAGVGPSRVRLHERRGGRWLMSRLDAEPNAGFLDGVVDRLERRLVDASGASLTALLDFGRMPRPPRVNASRLAVSSKALPWSQLAGELFSVSTGDLGWHAQEIGELWALGERLRRVARARDVVLTGHALGAIRLGIDGSRACSPARPALPGAFVKGAGDWLFGVLVAALAGGSDVAASLGRAVELASDSCSRAIVGEQTSQMVARMSRASVDAVLAPMR